MSGPRKTLIRASAVCAILVALLFFALHSQNPFGVNLFGPVARYVHRDKTAFYGTGTDIHEYRHIHLTGITAHKAEGLLATQLRANGYAASATTAGALEQVSYQKTDSDGVWSNITISDARSDGLQGVLISETHSAGTSELAFARMKNLGKNPVSQGLPQVSNMAAYLGE